MDKYLVLRHFNAPEIVGFLEAKEAVMGDVVVFIPTTYILRVGSNHMNLIHRHPPISLETCQRAAFTRFATLIAGGNGPIPILPWVIVILDPTNNTAYKDRFYNRVNGNVVVELIKTIFTVGGYDDLMLQSKKFAFTEVDRKRNLDGPTMVKVFLGKIVPTASANV